MRVQSILEVVGCGEEKQKKKKEFFSFSSGTRGKGTQNLRGGGAVVEFDTSIAFHMDTSWIITFAYHVMGMLISFFGCT